MTDQLVSLTASTEVYLRDTPFTPGQNIWVECVAASKKLYGVLSPGTNPIHQNGVDTKVSTTQKILQIGGDGSTVAFDDEDYPALANAHVDDGTLAEADRLRVVVLERGQNNEVLRILNRVESGDTPSDGEFKTSGSTVLTVGAALNEGARFEIWINDAADIETYSPTQYVTLPARVWDVMSADNAMTLLAPRPY